MKKLLLFSILLTAMACSHKPDIEVIVTANTNLCPNCYNEYRFLDSISEDCNLHLLFETTNPNEAQKFSDKFLKISRNYDIICDDSMFDSLTHNIFPWLYLYKDGELVFDAELNQSEKWIPILKKLQNTGSFGLVTAKLPDDVVLSEQNRCISLNDNYLIMDFSYHELHLFDENFKHIFSQDFSKADIEKLYLDIFGDRKTLREVRRYSDEISRYIPDFGKIKIDSQNAYFNAAPVITNYENAHFDLRHGIAESDFVLADAVHKSDGDFLLSYYWKKDRKLSLIDSSGSLIWTIHLSKGYDKVYLVDED